MVTFYTRDIIGAPHHFRTIADSLLDLSFYFSARYTSMYIGFHSSYFGDMQKHRQSFERLKVNAWKILKQKVRAFP